MFTQRVLLWSLAWLLFCSKAIAGDIYEVTSRDGEQDVTYFFINFLTT